VTFYGTPCRTNTNTRDNVYDAVYREKVIARVHTVLTSVELQRAPVDPETNANRLAVSLPLSCYLLHSLLLLLLA